MAMVWGGLHFLIVPRIAELRPWVEQQATEALGIPLRIGSVEARSNGLIPSLAFTDVHLLDAQGRVALRLPSVQVALSPRSLLGGGLEQLYVDSPVLDVRRTADGRLWVAGLLVSSGPSADSPAVDWVFSQYELAIRHGTVTWTDELRSAPPLTLTHVDWVLRNRHHTHAVRLDATPSAQDSARISLAGVFKQPLLSRHAGNWQEWKGQLYADLARVDLGPLRHYVDLGLEVAQGSGTLRAWVDINKGQVINTTVDMALNGVNVTVDKTLQALQFRWIAGRLGAKTVDGGMQYTTRALEFDTEDGLHWPGGNLSLSWFGGDGRTEPHGDLNADRLDLAAMAEIASRLPLGAALQQHLAGLSPKGVVQRLQARWQGAPDKPIRFSANGRIEHLDVAAQLASGGSRPGIKGVDLDFDVSQSGGNVNFSMRNGQLLAPAFFDEPHIPFAQLAGEIQWKKEAERWSVNVSDLRFANADAEGQFKAQWTAGGALGTLDLQGTIQRAELNRVYRYLPTGIDKSVRDYVRDAVKSGIGSAVRYKVRGDLADFPFKEPRKGEFRVSASLQNAIYAYAPASILARNSLPWPELNQLSADFLIDQGSLQILGAKASALGGNALVLSKVDAVVSNLYQSAQVAVNAEGRGGLSDLLTLVNGSPLGGMMGDALAQASASGPTDFRFKLGLPLAGLERTTVQGAINLLGNDLQVRLDTPRLSRARGAIAFSESGFSVANVQARALGGEVRIEGGLSTAAMPAPAGSRPMPQILRMQGTATAEGLRQSTELGLVARLAVLGTGQSTYTASLGLRAGIPELQISTSLVGMALALPEPFAKTADVAMPLRLETTALRAAQGPSSASSTRAMDQLQLSVGSLATVTYVRDVSGTDARVIRGAMGVGLTADESAPMPDQGVVANINVGQVDLDAWSAVLSQSSGEAITPGGVAAQATNAAMTYLPTNGVLRAQALTVGGRKFNHVLLGGGREGLLWRANLEASELNGYLEYRQSLGPQAGRLYARLARLSVEPSAAQDVENILDEQPASIPAMDIVVDDCELRGKKLGRVDIEAVNLGATGGRDVAREWRLNRFNITTPEASLKASGNWTNIVSLTEPAAGKSIKERRRTAMKFSLDITDAGALLERFGMPGVLRKGEGKIEGRVGWLGSPITLDYPSMGGNFNVNLETGQFLKADPGIAKLLGVLSLQSLPRRLALDFRDVFSDGFSFDFIRGDVSIEQGIAHTNNLQMKGVNAAVLMEGQADIAKETQSIKVVVVPEINAGSASLIASTINPLVGLSTFLAQLILRKPLIDAATQEFLVDGTWLDPRVTKVDHSAPATPVLHPKDSK